MNPFDWWHWLFETAAFRTPAQGLHLPQGLVWATLAAYSLTFLVFGAITALLLLFLWPVKNGKAIRPRYFRDPNMALCFALLTATTGAQALIRALMFAWPAYRFQSLTAFCAALVAFGVVSVMLPIALRRENEKVREERHDFANKVHTEELKLTTNLMRVERIREREEKALADLLEALRFAQQQAGPGGVL